MRISLNVKLAIRGVVRRRRRTDFRAGEKREYVFIPLHTHPILWIRSHEHGRNERGEHVPESTSVRDKRAEGRGRFTIGIYNLRIYNPSACRSYNRATAARVDTIRHESEVIFPGEMSREREREEFVGNAPMRRRAARVSDFFPRKIISKCWKEHV